MPARQTRLMQFGFAQVVIVAIGAASYGLASPQVRSEVATDLLGVPVVPAVPVPRQTPLVIQPLYDDPEVVSHEELAGVLDRILPRFPSKQLKPNFVEHALRTWSVRATFTTPGVMSGEEMKDYLVDHGRFLASWGDQITPLLQDRDDGVAVRWGREEGGSVHHDHWLASLTEAGVQLEEPVFTPNRRDRNMNDVLQEALRDLRLDEVETEWSALAFGLWLPPQKTWTSGTGRQMSFDRLAERLIRGDQKLGVCAGTHRVYSLMVLLRLHDQFQILSEPVREAAYRHLEHVRDRISVCQFPDGHWPSNWADGATALEQPIADELYKKVIATGHHLEWLAIAPVELHPPREQILKAADWLIETTLAQSYADIGQRYTFFSHVGNALAYWRKTHPVDFWAQWTAMNPQWQPPPQPEPKANPNPLPAQPDGEHPAIEAALAAPVSRPAE
jgi:hypothetical protein